VQASPSLALRLRPFLAPPKKRRLDILKGQVTVPPELFEPLSEEELQLWDS